MRKPTMGRDDRPRIYIAPSSDRTAKWRVGQHGRDRYSGTAASAMDEALEHINYVEAVIFWEGTNE